MKTADSGLRRDALAILKAGLEAADAGNAVRRNFSCSGGFLRAGTARIALKEFDRIFLIGAGKASVQMAAAVIRVLPCRLSGGLVVTKRDTGAAGSAVFR